MKIKHWQGYGNVDAVKVAKIKHTTDRTELIIKVTGNHEYGLVRDDKYDLYHWLVKRFDRNVKDSQSIIDYCYRDDYVKVDGLDVEQCTYSFLY